MSYSYLYERPVEISSGSTAPVLHDFYYEIIDGVPVVVETRN